MTQIIDITDNPFGLKTFHVFRENAKLGSIDIETTVEDNPWRNPPTLVSVAISFDGVRAFVFNEWDIYKVRPHLESMDWIMHNGLFDRLMMKEFFNIDLPLKHDTMAMQYLLDPDKKKSLEYLSEEYLGLPAYKSVDYHNILEEPWDKVAAMNGEDAVRTYNLLRPLGDQLNNDPALSRVYQWILMPAINDLIEITHNGIPLVGDRVATVTAATRKEADELLVSLRQDTPVPDPEVYPKGWPRPSSWRVRDLVDSSGEILVRGMGKWEGLDFNPGSWKQVAHILYDIWDLPILEWNKDDDGNETTPSTNADVLLMLETYETQGDQQDWLHSLRAYRKATKLLTYFEAWPDQTDDSGWLHPRYRPLKTKTGRLSSDSPNIQNVPRSKEVRKCFGDVDGYVWMKADYSQMELRLAASAAEEITLLEAFRNGDDPHRLTAKLVLGDISDDARQVAKTLNFGLLYGAGPGMLQKVARSDYDVFLSTEEARQYHKLFFRAYPGIKRWHDRCHQEIEVSGISRSPLGRVRYLPKAKIPPHVEDMWTKKMAAIREGINHRIQSYASDILLVSLNQIMKEIKATPWEPDVLVVAEVHDEIDFLVPDHLVESFAPFVRKIMEDTSWLKRFGITLDVPVLASVEVGPNWGELKEIT
jgi:DNA polymerase I-like protein with 3'-5' exonuclease and polymerase domains